jgi:hypothetical protein
MIDLFTNQFLLRPDRSQSWLFWRRNVGYLTISEAADRYCRASPWQAGVADVVRGNVAPPATGEVYSAPTNQSAAVKHLAA